MRLEEARSGRTTDRDSTPELEREVGGGGVRASGGRGWHRWEPFFWGLHHRTPEDGDSRRRGGGEGAALAAPARSPPESPIGGAQGKECPKGTSKAIDYLIH